MATDNENRAASLAAAFLIHEGNGNEAGLQAIIDEINANEVLLHDFVRGLSAFALNFGRKAYGDGLTALLQHVLLASELDMGQAPPA
jgi:hypothetical protein